MHRIRATVFGLLCSLVLSLPALAQTAVISDNPPYSIKSGDRPGFCVELVNEMAKLLKTKVTYQFMGWGDAQAKVMAGQDLLIFPFARTPEREPNYGWLQQLFEDSVVFVSAPGTAPIDTVEQAKALASVGVLDGSPWDKELAKRGLTNVKRYPTSPAMVAAIVAHEIPAAYGPDIELKYAWRVGGYQGAPVVGKQIEKLGQYLAMSKNSPSIKVADWQDAFNALQQDGTFDRVYASYFGAK
ncbi:MAG TPA: transporter substrate-binding domain-containing protein [Stellaceae bacterium]|jgi:polar amino acid transport system substrate-binding protein|nr:transporter substrate-binding domain-containing protein [Stellaceae bacterium]